MATDNPRITAYIQPVNSERLKEYQQLHGLTTSQAVDRILSEYFTGATPTTDGVTLKTDSTPPSITPVNLEDTIGQMVEARTQYIVDSFNDQLSRMQEGLEEVRTRLGE